MQIKKFNIVNPKPYGDPDPQTGKQKNFWASVGSMTEFYKDDGSVSRIIELNDSNIKFSVFPVEDRDQKPSPAQRQTSDEPAPTTNGVAYPDEAIDLSEIPF